MINPPFHAFRAKLQVGDGNRLLAQSGDPRARIRQIEGERRRYERDGKENSVAMNLVSGNPRDFGDLRIDEGAVQELVEPRFHFRRDSRLREVELHVLWANRRIFAAPVDSRNGDASNQPRKRSSERLGIPVDNPNGERRAVIL